MSLEDELYDTERGLWEKGADFYRAHLADECVLAFPGMTGVQSREKIAASATDDNRFHDVTIDRQGFLQPAASVAIVCYNASAAKADGTPHKALVTSCYIEREGGWKLVSHSQTPMNEKP